MNLSQKAYIWLRTEWLSGDTLHDDRVSISTLTSRSGLGRTPVRDAVNRLAAEGLLETMDRSGIAIRVPSTEELREIVGLREALEPYAAEQAAARMDYAQARRLRGLSRDMVAVARGIRDAGFGDEALHRRMRALDWAFHNLILEAAGNGRLLRIVEGQHLLSQKVRYPSLRTVRHLALTVLEHERIARAVTRGDGAAARLWMLRHARRGGNAMLENSREREGDVPPVRQARRRRHPTLERSA